MIIPRLMLVLWGAWLAAAGIAFGAQNVERAAVDLHVAAHGSDTAEGSANRPFATLDHVQLAARKAVRQQPGAEVTVWLHAGTYELAEPLVFGLEDSGKASVTYRARPGERVVLSGGQRLSGWRTNGTNQWTMQVPGVKEGRWYPRQLFINGQRRIRARMPNEGFLRGLNTEDARRVEFPSGTLGTWTHPEDIELITLVEWTSSRACLGKVNPTASTVDFGPKVIQFFDEPWGQHIRGNLAHLPFYFENALEFLDSPGEWYLDRQTGQLSYLPKPGERIETLNAVMPRLEQLIVVRGSPGKPVRNLRLVGLTFAHADWPLPKDGFLPDQAGLFDTENSKKGFAIPSAALDFQYASGCTIEDCQVEGLGGYAIRFREGCASNLVSRCVIEGIGGNGVSLGLFDGVSVDADAVVGNEVRNCTLRQCGLDHLGSVGIWVGIARETTIAHNELAELPYGGISCGWSWDRRQVGCRKNVIEGNHIHHVARLLADIGGIYVLGDQPGGVIRGNYIHDIKRFSGLASVNGIFFDNGSRGWRVEDNVIHDVTDGAIRHNDNLHEDQSWGTNFFDIKPASPGFPTALTQKTGPTSITRP